MSRRPGTHRCPWPGCPRYVKREMWGCFAHWSKLPEPLRRALNRAWYGGTVAQHSAALEAIDDWIEQNVTRP